MRRQLVLLVQVLSSFPVVFAPTKQERNGSSMGHNSDSDTDTRSDMCMEGADLVMVEAKETRKAAKRARPSRESIHTFCWRLQGVSEDEKGSLIQTHESL